MKPIVYVCGLILGSFILFQFASSQTQQPIKCYQCNSFYDKGCSDWFDNKTYPLIPCPGNATMCRKIIQETYYEGIWDVRYIRQCAMRGEVGPDEGRWCKERTGTFQVKVKYCHCDNKDGCNSAPSIQNCRYLLLLPIALLTLLNIMPCVSSHLGYFLT